MDYHYSIEDIDPEAERDSEWAYRAPTLHDAWLHAQQTWDGPRCHHGFALLPFGPDVWCGACEAEAYEEVDA